MASSDVTRLVFGLVAAAPGSAAEDRFEALAVWMREHVGVDLQRCAAATYYDLAMLVRQGLCDVAWLPPVSFAWLGEAVTPLGSIVRDGQTSYSSALVVREDSRLHGLHEIRGLRAGWVDPWSAAGYVVPRIELARIGLDPRAIFRTETFLGTHHDALQALQRGDCDLAGTYARTRYDGEGAVEGAWTELAGVHVRVLATFGSIPADVIAVPRALVGGLRERAQQAFRDACTHPDGKPLVRAVFGGDAFRDGAERGHVNLRHAYEGAVAHGLFDE